MRNKNYYINLFKTINYNFSSFDNEVFNLHLEDYLNFLEEEKNIQILSKICDVVKIFLFSKKHFFQNFDIDEYHKVSIMALILFKSISKSSKNESIYSVNYSNSDFVLNELINNYKNLSIFYYQKEPYHEEIHSIRGDTFKIIKYLILEGVVVCKNYYYQNRTLEEWSFGSENIVCSFAETLKLLDKSPKIININNNFYCVGDFFIFVKKIFIENTKSEYFFKINDANYINNMSNLHININLNDLNDVISHLNKKYISKDSIDLIIKKNNKIIFKNLEDIKLSKKIIKKNIRNMSKNNVLKILTKESDNLEINEREINDKEVEKAYIDTFLNFSKNFIKKNVESLEFTDSELIELIYKEFIEKFNNAFVKIKVNDIDELLALSKDFIEFNVDLEEDVKKIEKLIDSKKIINSYSENEEILNEVEKLEDKEDEKNIIKKKLINKEKKKEIILNKKIDPFKIPLIKYLILYSKKEIEEILKKIIKNLDKVDSIDNLNLNFLSTTKIENLFKIGCCIFMKFGERDGINIYKTIKYIESLDDENKNLFAEISQISHIYNIYFLYEYLITNKFFIKNTDEFKNIKIFFMFFFDFRGRFYYDSPISPTTNRFCRFIYNYGVFKKNEISDNFNKINLIVLNQIKFINLIKKKFNIIEDSNFINESIFWVLISIGKIKINKSKIEIKIDEFFITAIKIINNEIILEDELDLVEYDYYKKIIKNLNNDYILKRCLVKDATASFFQNLIRILGAKDENSKKIANLNSEDTWYDWYTYILKTWKDSKIESEYDYLFTRKTIKKVAMTFPYSATYTTCYEYFKDSVFENFKINISKNNDITKEFKSFYTFIKELMKSKGPFKESTESINKHFKKILEKGEPVLIISKDDDLTNLTYYKTITKHFDFIIKWQNTTKRIIKNYVKIDKSKIDKRKTNSALKANLVHFVDALLIRDINCEIYLRRKTYYLSVHDSFLVDFTQTSEFILIANQSFNKNVFKNEIWENEKNFFSIFIFL